MSRINLIAASRQRPVRMAKVYRKWMENSRDPSSMRTIICIDSDDPTGDQYHSLLNPISKEYNTDLLIISSQNKCTVEAINSGKPHINGDIILIFSDDTDCFINWDRDLIDFTKDLNAKYVIRADDGIGDILITMPIFSKEYLDSFDYIYHPSYSHMFCDTELTCVAHLLGCVIDGSNFLFSHLHYSKLHHDRDAIDDKNQSTFYTGMDNFVKRMAKNFDIKDELINGEIPKEIVDWVNKKD
jgi:hypothetical protein